MAEPQSTLDDPGLFVLFDADRCALATTEVFTSYAEAADAIDSRMHSVLILRLPFDEGPAEPDEDEACACEQPGAFCSGVPGILAQVKNGQVVSGTKVERCDLCDLYASDEAALEHLRNLGMVPADYRDFSRCEPSPSGQHAADPASAQAADGAGQNRGTDWLVEFHCRYCGKIGSIRVEPAHISWD